MPKKKLVIFQGDRSRKGGPVKHKIRAVAVREWKNVYGETCRQYMVSQ